MHKSSMARMNWFVNTYLNDKKKRKILDVGSYNVNGCYKELFCQEKFEYEGLDMENGPNVDIVPQNTYNWQEINNDNYDVIISGQALEHIEFFWVTVAEMIRVTKRNGLICIIAPNGFGEHRYPVDCWRFFTDGMIALARYYKLEIIHAHTNSAPTVEDHDWYSEDCGDSMLIAKKPYSGEAEIVSFQDYTCIPEDHKKVNNGMKHYKAYKENIASKKEEEEKMQEQEESREKIKIQETKVNRAIRKAMTLKNKAINKIRRKFAK